LGVSSTIAIFTHIAIHHLVGAAVAISTASGALEGAVIFSLTSNATAVSLAFTVPYLYVPPFHIPMSPAPPPAPLPVTPPPLLILAIAPVPLPILLADWDLQHLLNPLLP
jgi:hypothetical protein